MKMIFRALTISAGRFVARQIVAPKVSEWLDNRKAEKRQRGPQSNHDGLTN